MTPILTFYEDEISSGMFADVDKPNSALFHEKAHKS